MSRAVSPVSGKPYGLAASAGSGGLPDPGFIATSRRRGPTHRHRGGADQRARCPTMR
jgi:hypothetical protein